MAKTKDMILVELYDAEIVRMVTAHLEAKHDRRADRDRKIAESRKHYAQVCEKRGEIL